MEGGEGGCRPQRSPLGNGFSEGAAFYASGNVASEALRLYSRLVDRRVCSESCTHGRTTYVCFFFLGFDLCIMKHHVNAR